MKTVLFILFLAIMTYLVTSFIKDMMNKGKPNEEEEKPSLNSWIIPAIITSLVVHEMLSKEEAEELEGLSQEEVEEYLVNQDIFDSREEMEDWILSQPELSGTGDSVFGGIDQTDRL
jgi:hypothetical protein